MTRRRSLAVVAVAAVGTVALATGIAQGSSGSEGRSQLATIDTSAEGAALRPCPGAAPIGELDGGATIELTGRSEDGAWLQMASPIETVDEVWIDADLVVVTTPEDLPIARCGEVDLAIQLIGGAELTLTPKTTTTTTPDDDDQRAAGDDDGTTTTEPDGDGDGDDDDETTTTAGGGSPTTPPTTRPGTTSPSPTTTRPRPPTTVRPTTTTTTLPPDVTPPTVDSFTKNRARIQEQGCNGPVRVLLTARVQDASGLDRVRVIWRIDDAVTGTTLVNGSVAMTAAGGDVWQVHLGPYGPGTVSANAGVLKWRVLATDASSNHNEVIVDPGSALHLPVQDCP